jgi:hypothetical protein
MAAAITAFKFNAGRAGVVEQAGGRKRPARLGRPAGRLDLIARRGRSVGVSGVGPKRQRRCVASLKTGRLGRLGASTIAFALLSSAVVGALALAGWQSILA